MAFRFGYILGTERKIRRKRDGIDGTIYFLPGLFNNELNFRLIDKSTVELIKTQSEGTSDVHECDMSELYAQDVQLISKDGKVYYLPVFNSPAGKREESK